MKKLIKRLLVACLGLSAVLGGGGDLLPAMVEAHGERATEPYIRTRTVHWYDMTWSKDSIAVNDTYTIKGKFRLFSDWPDAAARPELLYVSAYGPGAVLTRVESRLNGLPAQQSFRGGELGRDYEFEITMKGRVPGRWHVHTIVQVEGAGAIVGPGKWIEVTGSASDYKQSLETMTGNKIDDLQTYKVADAQRYHLFLGAFALAWLLWWLRRPLIIPRWLAIQKGRSDLLVRPIDDKVAAAMVGVMLLITVVGYHNATQAYPYTVPLRGGWTKIPTQPLPEEKVRVDLTHAEYDVPGRSLRMRANITNTLDKPVRIGEFMTAELRFINKALPAAVANVTPGYPQELLPGQGLKVDNDLLAPGETRSVYIEATDAVWEVERLVSFLSDVDSRIGGLVFFWDEKGERYVSELHGPIVPVIKGHGTHMSM
ncbi:ammonia monooxygenase subunit B /particulate methane monooxygenase PmoB subunit apoprotein [Solimonas aquatica]|uniref:Ammonia monooxygenase subunit B /particulate methane monooxygenase PmoB subunit apoprotein n=1 Tax=Solimonas aquatica TaxID=489703 RepID=A0A1H9JCA3_9GAMM|nr:bacterial ammonia monooxygenase, subunit AmoB [Solimonas aquatica]SEQ84514.1 ammonia monooxygenase subunit B /particulate methane monooxygenase PmoB subunit apoprotein [Solimonas aquatica]